MYELFEFAYAYFIALDTTNITLIGNYPIHFIIECGKCLGYNILGNYSAETPYLNAIEGTFSSHPPSAGLLLLDEDIQALARLLVIVNIEKLNEVPMNAAMRNRLLDWYIQFLQYHTQHLSGLKSLEILRIILH